MSSPPTSYSLIVSRDTGNDSTARRKLEASCQKEARSRGHASFAPGPLDNHGFPAYTSNMNAEHPNPAATPCLCNALQASRAVSRLYDDELRGVGLRTTQYSLLRAVARAGQVRQSDLSELTSLDETTLTRNLRPLVEAHWLAVQTGDDRREKLVKITKAGNSKLTERPRPGNGRNRHANAAASRNMAGPPGSPSRACQAIDSTSSFFPCIDAYTAFCRGQRLAASCKGSAM